jgi:hypothetical protein
VKEMAGLISQKLREALELIRLLVNAPRTVTLTSWDEAECIDAL